MKYVPKDKDCFVCGSDNKYGLNLDFMINENSVSASFIPSIKYSGFKGILHGGIISSVLDDAMDWAIYAKTGFLYVTSSLNVRFIKPVYLERELLVTGFATDDYKESSKIQTATAELRYKDNGELLAKSEGKFFKVPFKI